MAADHMQINLCIIQCSPIFAVFVWFYAPIKIRVMVSFLIYAVNSVLYKNQCFHRNNTTMLFLMYNRTTSVKDLTAYWSGSLGTRRKSLLTLGTELTYPLNLYSWLCSLLWPWMHNSLCIKSLTVHIKPANRGRGCDLCDCGMVFYHICHFVNCQKG